MCGGREKKQNQFFSLLAAFCSELSLPKDISPPMGNEGFSVIEERVISMH